MTDTIISAMHAEIEEPKKVKFSFQLILKQLFDLLRHFDSESRQLDAGNESHTTQVCNLSSFSNLKAFLLADTMLAFEVKHILSSST